MRPSWEKISFEAAPFQIIDGDRGTSYPKQNDFADSGYCLFLNTGNVLPDGFYLSKCQFISESKDQELRKGRLSRGDVVLTTRGTIGNIGIYDDRIQHDVIRINSGMVILRPDPSRLLPYFLFQFLRSPYFKEQVNALRSGAAQPQLPIRDMKRILLPFPGIECQERIVTVLSAYDDLIEANQRRIHLLEESARLLYREWFVKLRFPGHETVPVTDGVPKGWTICKLSEVADVNSSSLTAKDRPEAIRYVDISSVGTGKIDVVDEISFEEAPGRARRKVQHGDIIWSCVRPNRRSYALIWEPQDNLIVSTGFAVLTAKSIPFSYLYLASTTDDFVSYLTNQATGVAYPAVSAKDFEKALLLLPDTGTLADFDKFVLPLLEQIDAVNCQNKQLSHARDMLLPRLMSGALDVSHIAVPLEVEV